MKKKLQFIFISALLISLVSCTDNVNSHNSNRDSNTITSEIAKESEIISSHAVSEKKLESTTKTISETSVPLTKSDIPELSYNFEGLVSQKYVQALTDRNYVMTYTIPDMNITQRICMDGSNVFSSFTNNGMSYDMLYKDNIQYIIYKHNYAKVAVSGTAENLVKIFSEIGYVESGETEYDGEKCKYDQFYQTAFDQTEFDTKIKLLKLIINPAGDFVAFDQAGTIARIDEFSTQADESLFSIPDDYKEVDENTIQQLFADEYSSIIGVKNK